MKISIKSIKPNPNNVRTMFDPLAINDLAENIKAIGLIHPIVVFKTNGEYQVIAGDCRFRAFQTLAKSQPKEYDEIPATVIPKPDSVGLSAINIAEGLFRTDVTPLQIGQHLAKLKKEMVPGKLKAEEFWPTISKLFGLKLSHRRMKELVSFAEKAPEEIRQMVESGQVSMRTGEQTKRKPRKKHPIAKIQEGVSPKRWKTRFEKACQELLNQLEDAKKLRVKVKKGHTKTEALFSAWLPVKPGAVKLYLALGSIIEVFKGTKKAFPN